MTDKIDICLLCVGPVADDPRVRKQGECLQKSGFNVAAVGLSGAIRANPTWPIYEIERGLDGLPQPQGKLSKIGNKLKALTHQVPKLLACFSSRYAHLIYWQQPIFRELYGKAKPIKARLYVANDWNTLPIAARLAAENDGVFIYDTHEYAAEELPESWRWRLFQRDLAIAMERRFIGQAKVVSTVSDGIATDLKQDHGLSTKPLVMRNVPEQISVQASEDANSSFKTHDTSGPVKVLFQGSITPYRGLHTVVESLPLWDARFHLTLRGPISPDYRQNLLDLAHANGVSERLDILPPIDPARLVAEAANSTIGLVSLPATSQQNRYALPNKLFEYMHAGVAILAPDLKEIAACIKSTNAGVLFERLEPAILAEALNGLSAADIEKYRANAKRAAQTLIWSKEVEPWIAEIAKLVPAKSSDSR